MKIRTSWLKILIINILIFIFMACKNQINQKVENESVEDKISEMILSLPEVIEQTEHVKKVTSDKNHVKVMITETPKDNNDNHYCVKVCEDNGENISTIYDFYVYKNFEIKYYDVVNDTVLSLETWRKNKKN